VCDGQTDGQWTPHDGKYRAMRHAERRADKTINPLMPTVAIWVQLHSVPDRVKPSFVIFDIRAL